MRQFTSLFQRLDQTRSTHEKVAALVAYFREATPEDAISALALLIGRRPRRTVNTGLLRAWAAECSGIPEWLFEESYHTVGDLAETIALLVDGSPDTSQSYSLSERLAQLKSLEKATEEEKKEFITQTWASMDPQERLLFNKLITGGFRIGVSQKLVEKALSEVYSLEADVLAHRLTGNWNAETTTLNELIFNKVSAEDLSKPYPFALAHPLQDQPESLGEVSEWLAEWKWDGIRSQVIVRGAELFLWSRGEELITTKFPELQPLAALLPDGTVIDAELVIFKNGGVQPFQALQTRIGRKNVSKKHLSDFPAALIAYDLFEWNGEDIRLQTLAERRHRLHEIVQQTNSSVLMLSEALQADTWSELSEIRLSAREHQAEGLMLKRLSSSYQVGRKRGDWWKWKLDPMSVDAVLIYAMQGHGRRANLYTDYTFAVWNDEGRLVPFTKAYSGLTDAEIKEVDAFVKANTIEKFGPVRSVKAELVFEIGFEGIQRSSRHKSGVALRFPRMLRWRKDKPAAEADRLSSLFDLLEQQGA
jgi:DNA ligase-1